MSSLKAPVTEMDHRRGNFPAAIVMVEYGDFQCPYCGSAYSVIEEVVKQLGSEVCFVFRHFPIIEAHPFAEAAAMAAEAASQQDKFWPMHQILFQHQDKLSVPHLLSYAHQLGLDMNRFTQDIQREDLMERVQGDYISGERSGVNGTPAIFLNGRRFGQEVTFENLLVAAKKILKGENAEVTF
jgi:protein-disulfide isomerase